MATEPYRRGMNIVVTSRSGPVDADLRQQVEAVDQALRQNFSGFDPDEIVPEIRTSFEHLPVRPDGDDVTRYARAISDRADFELVVD